MERDHSPTARADSADVDWLEWHADYDDPHSPLSQRLSAVKARIAEAIDHMAPGPRRIISMCAGQGRDVIDVLATHPRGNDVQALLVESDQRNVDEARRRASVAGLDQRVTVTVGDASLTEAYRSAVPADLVVCCGVFGNISLADIESTIAALPGLCAPDAFVVWTRHRRAPDVTPTIREWFEHSGFKEVGFDAPDGYVFAVGSDQLIRPPAAFGSGRLFSFVGDGSLPA